MLGKDRMNKCIAAIGAVLTTSAARADWEVNMPRGVTDVSADVYNLHMLVLWVCVVIGVVVFAAMIYAITRYRHSDGAVPAKFSHSNTAELIWTVIPVLILIGMAIPAARTLVRIEDTSGSEMTIKITGYQWKWHYEYVDAGVSFFSSLSARSNAARQLGANVDPATVDNYLLDVDRPLIVPVGVKIRYLITSNDVLHAWWMPDFAVKKDAIPGFINEGWFKVNEPGTYRGQCAELCGKDHGFMPVVVEALPRDEYDAWLAARQQS